MASRLVLRTTAAAVPARWGRADDRWPLTASYSFGDTTVAAGIDDAGGEQNWRFSGVSLHSHPA